MQHTREELGRKLLYDLCQGNLKEAFEEVRQGARVDVTDGSGASALGIAALNGVGEMVEQLIERNADVDHKDHEGFTPLMNAAQSGHGHIVWMLLKAGANPDERNPAGQTATDIAKESGHVIAANMIIDAHAEKQQAVAEEWKNISVEAAQDITVSKPLQFKLGPKAAFSYIKP